MSVDVRLFRRAKRTTGWGRIRKGAVGGMGTTRSMDITYYLKIPLCNNGPSTRITHNLKRKK